MTVSVLHMLKNMLNFGMYDNKRQLENLLKELLNLLHGTCDVTTQDELDYLEDPNRISANKGYPNHEINWIKLKNRRSRVFRYRSRYDPNNEDILQIITAKSQVCSILKIVYQFIQEANISQFLYHFKQGLTMGRHTKIKNIQKGHNVINPFESEQDEEFEDQVEDEDDDNKEKVDEDADFGYQYLNNII